MKIGPPVNVEVLLHCHTTPAPHPNIEAKSTKDAINRLLEGDCITPEDNYYRTTELGRAWVKAICNTEMPKIKYVDAQGNVL